MTKISKNFKEVRLESYYIWECPRCHEFIEGFDSDLKQIGYSPFGARVYSFYCPICEKFTEVMDNSLDLLTKGEGVIDGF